MYQSEQAPASGSITARLLLINFVDENGVHFVYSPHLDLSGYGYTKEEAKESFDIVFDDFMDYTLEKGTLNKVLSKLGWKTKESKKHHQLMMPSIATVIKENDYVSEIFDKYSVETSHWDMVMPAQV